MERTGMKFIVATILTAALGSNWVGAEDFHDWVAIHSNLNQLELAVETYGTAIDDQAALATLRTVVAEFEKLDQKIEDLGKFFPGTENSLRIFAKGGYYWPAYRGIIVGVLAAFMEQLEVLNADLESLEATSANPRPRFIRGDVNGDGEADLTDAIEILKYKFLGTATPACTKAADVDDSGDVDQTDAINLMLHLFQGGPAPAEPRRCGADPTPDQLSCASQSSCGA